MLRMAGHIHVQNVVCVKFFHDMFGCNSDGGDEEFRFGLDDDVDQFVEISSREVDLIATRSALRFERGVLTSPTFVFRAEPPTCGRRRSTPNGRSGSRKRDYSEILDHRFL